MNDNTPKLFKDKNGNTINPGDTIVLHTIAKRKEHYGRNRVAINMMGNESIVADEGEYLEGIKCWIAFKVCWDGACLVANRIDMSDTQIALCSDHFDSNGKQIACAASGFHYMNEVFESEKYIIADIAL